MGRTFAGDTTPTSANVTDVLIPWADSIVDTENSISPTTTEQELLSSLMTAHLITLSSADTKFKIGEISIEGVKREKTPYLFSYESTITRIAKKEIKSGAAYFKKANA